MKDTVSNVSVVHEPRVPFTGELRCGDRLWLGGRLIPVCPAGAVHDIVAGLLLCGVQPLPLV